MTFLTEEDIRNSILKSTDTKSSALSVFMRERERQWNSAQYNKTRLIRNSIIQNFTIIKI
jgi:hypothetical protein